MGAIGIAAQRTSVAFLSREMELSGFAASYPFANECNHGKTDNQE